MGRLRTVAGDAPVNAGERAVVSALVEHLPTEYGVFPNFEVRDRAGRRLEIDVVVTAPHAVYVIETKAYAGTVEGDDREWVVNDRVQPSPIRLVSQKARVLKGLLQDNLPALVDAWVEPAVVLAFPPRELRLVASARESTFSCAGLVEFVTDATRLAQAGRATRLVERAEHVLSSIARRRSGPRAFGDWKVVEVLSDSDDVTEYRAKHRFAAGAPAKRLRVVELSPYLMDPAELEAQRRRVVREYAALCTMGAHPNVVGPEAALEDGSSIVLVEQEHEGLTLGLALAEGLDVDDDERCRWLVDLARAVQHAHAHGVVHRRIGPEACLLATDGSLRLSGFGSAHVATEGTIYHELGANDIDPGYIAPELLDGLGAAGPAADVFSVGCIAHSLWAGQPPHADSRRIRNEPATAPPGMPALLWGSRRCHARR